MKLSLVLCATSLLLAQATAEKKVVCYWSSWSVYRQADGNFEPENIDPTLCTHLIYAFVGFGQPSNGEIRILDPWLALPDSGGKDAFNRFNRLREQNPKLKTMLAVGGYNDGSTLYSQAAADPSARNKVVESAVALVKKYGFDGLDMDWEYPEPADKQNFVLLLKELRERLNQDGLLLSAAVGAPESRVSQSYGIPEISKYLDFINIMAYDLTTSQYQQLETHSALFKGLSDSGDTAKLNVETIVNHWLAKGVPSEKIILGVPFYGRTFTLSNPQSTNVGAAASVGAPGPHTKEAGTLSYSEICEKLISENWRSGFDEERRVAYAFSSQQWTSYDNQQTIKEKAELIKQYNLGGGMVWSIEMDDFRGKCGEKFPLLKTLSRELLSGASSSPSTIPVKNPIQESKPERQPTEQPSRMEPVLPLQFIDDKSIDDEICQADGHAKDPDDCAKYYICQHVNGEYMKYSQDCPSGTLFDSTQKLCDHANLVQC